MRKMWTKRRIGEELDGGNGRERTEKMKYQ